jgi:hypothetical protein
MSKFKIALSIVNQNEKPAIDVHYEWGQHALWLSGKYGFGNIDGHEIGLSSELVQDLIAWGDAADALFDQEDPANSELPENHYETGFDLAKRVRRELSQEWIVTTKDPVSYRRIELSC